MATRRVQSYTNRYLDEALERLKLPSDYALAEALGVTTQAIYKMRGGGAMSTTTAAKIAEILELDPMQVIADVELERATRPDERELWKRIRATAAAVLGLVGAAVLYRLVTDAPGAFDLTQFCVSARAHAEALVFALGMPAFNVTNTHCVALALAIAAAAFALLYARRAFSVRSVRMRTGIRLQAR